MTKTKRASRRPRITPAPSPAAPSPAPDWLTNTPEITYTLYAFGNDHRYGQLSHEVLLTREEFIALKLHLAKLRGYKVPARKEASHAS